MRVLIFLIFFGFVSAVQASTMNSQKLNVEVGKKKAVILAKRTIGGKTLKITEENEYYTVRILKSDGHVVDLYINKKTGEVKKDQ